MNHLVSIRTNIFYGKKEKDGKEEYVKFNELIFLVDKPTYIRTNDDEIIRERAIEELRFSVSEKAFDELIKHLVKLKGTKEGELF